MRATSARRVVAAFMTSLGLTAALLFAATPTPAHAATELLVSLDGVTFTPTLSAGLFDDLGVMVPMDTETATFWVKNPTVDAASLRVSVQDLVVSSAVLASSIMLTTWDDGTGVTNSAQLNTLSDCDIVVPAQTILGGAIIRVDLTITMMNVTGFTAQDQLGVLNFLAAMRDAAAGPFPSSACDDDGVTIASNLPAQMAHTGSDLPTDWLVASGVALGLGILLVVRSRRKRDDEALAE